MNVAVNSAAHLAAHSCVAASARSLTHLQVRSLTCSSAPSTALAICADSRFAAAHLAAAPSTALATCADFISALRWN